MPPEIQAVVDAALALTETMSWGISDNGGQEFQYDPELAGALLDATIAYRQFAGLTPPARQSIQIAIRNLAKLVH